MKIDNAKFIIPQTTDKGVSSQKRVSIFNEKNRKDLLWIDLDLIRPFKHQSRTYFAEEEILALSSSIKEVGVLNPLILVKSAGEELYEVISGERRLRASKLANLKKVPAFVVLDEKEATLISVIDNVQRENLQPLEFAKACQTLLDTGTCASTQEIAESIGVSKSKVVEALGLLKLPEPLQEKLIEHNITARSVLRKLNKVSNIEIGLQLIKDEVQIKEKPKNILFKSSFTGGEVSFKINELSLITSVTLDEILRGLKEDILKSVAAATR